MTYENNNQGRPDPGRADIFLNGYYRAMNGTECPIMLINIEDSKTKVGVMTGHGVEERSAFEIKAAMDFSKMSGVGLGLAIQREDLKRKFKSTPLGFWSGVYERWSDEGVAISVNGGHDWARFSFKEYESIGDEIVKAYEAYMAGETTTIPMAWSILAPHCDEKYREPIPLTDDQIGRLIGLGFGKPWGAEYGKSRMYYNVKQDYKAYIDTKDGSINVNGESGAIRQRIRQAMAESLVAASDDNAWAVASEKLGKFKNCQSLFAYYELEARSIISRARI